MLESKRGSTPRLRKRYKVHGDGGCEEGACVFRQGFRSLAAQMVRDVQGVLGCERIDTQVGLYSGLVFQQWRKRGVRVGCQPVLGLHIINTIYGETAVEEVGCSNLKHQQ